nr:nuclear transport factor 2 family protein [Kibdelosporangium sp. MJ126-NF4]CEL21747.1 hypothetical protein [Kibdelosporangium sp. MJ126-NF4]CTQ92527.1 hypothetical protein [Kibdelosporangium sp. MJ126-NF4]
MTRTARRLLTAVALAAGVTLASLPTSVAQTSETVNATHDNRQVPRIVQQWANAWNKGDAAALGALFTQDGTYTDHAFQASFTGPAGVRQWVAITTDSIKPLKVTVASAFRSGDHVSVTWTFSGTFTDNSPFEPPHNPAGRSFSVPATSVFTLRHDRIKSVADFYNLADLLRQVGLPAGPFTPPGLK